MNKNRLLEEYYQTFKELPPILVTASYDDSNYQMAMDYAILNNEKLTYDNIGKFFKNNYDLVIKDDNSNNEGDTDMELDKIKNLLAKYGASDNEIKNFIEDLTEEANETEKVEDEDDDEDYVLDKDTTDKLKLTREGKQLIIDAPTMAKDELKKAIETYLENHK